MVLEERSQKTAWKVALIDQYEGWEEISIAEAGKRTGKEERYAKEGEMLLEERIQSTNFRKSDHSRSAEKLLEEGVLTQERKGGEVCCLCDEWKVSPFKVSRTEDNFLFYSLSLTQCRLVVNCNWLLIQLKDFLTDKYYFIWNFNRFTRYTR